MIGQRVGASYRDPSGFVYRRNGVLLRQVNASYGPDYDALVESGLYDELAHDDLLVRHVERSLDLALEPGAHRVLEPTPVPLVSYPYEWCFGQLREAALLTLEIQRRALARGLVLKDASAFNVQFVGPRPVLIDTLSFERYREGRPWIAYRQFCQHFIAPLVLASRIDPWLLRYLVGEPDGIPLDVASRLLPLTSWLRPATLLHVHLHARSLRRHAATDRPHRGPEPRVGRTGLEGLVDNLAAIVRRLHWSPPSTEWSEYEDEHGYPEAARRDKERLVEQALLELAPTTVWDLGANTGVFSRLASQRAERVVAIDADRAVVERLYRSLRAEGERRILPLVADIALPTPATGWANAERASLIDRGPADLVLALALVHHLALGRNVGLPMIADLLARLGRHVVVEFVPKEDPQAQRLLASREDIFDDYARDAFERCLEERFRVRYAHPIRSSHRWLYVCSSPSA